jgi:hypothetical protein
VFDFGSVPGFLFGIGRTSPGGVLLSGTAFALNKAGHFATAFHTVGTDDANLVLAMRGMKHLDEFQDTANAQVQLFPVKVLAADPMHDLIVLTAENAVQCNIMLAGADHVTVGTAISSFGYPHADQGRMVVTRQDAEVGARVLIEAGGVKSKHLVLNTQARPGQSGSPVFRRDDGRLVAVLVGSYAPAGGGGISLGGIDPHTLHQTTHAVSAEYLKGMY